MGTHFLGFPGRYDACYIILGMGEFGTMENMGQPFNRRMFIMWISTQPQSEDGEHGNLRGYDHLSRFPERESQGLPRVPSSSIYFHGMFHEKQTNQPAIGVPPHGHGKPNPVMSHSNCHPRGSRCPNSKGPVRSVLGKRQSSSSSWFQTNKPKQRHSTTYSTTQHQYHELLKSEFWVSFLTPRFNKHRSSRVAMVWEEPIEPHALQNHFSLGWGVPSFEMFSTSRQQRVGKWKIGNVILYHGESQIPGQKKKKHNTNVQLVRTVYH